MSLFRGYADCLAILLLAAVGCSGPGGHEHAATGQGERRYQGDYPIQIVATVGQVAEMVRQVGGTHVQVHALMGPGVDPHLYKPLPQDRSALSSADAVFYVGLHLEGRMADLFTRMARQRLTYPVTEGLQLRGDPRLREPPEFEGMYDPHVWHDAQMWSDCVGDVAETLAAFDPVHTDDYRKNAAAYREELEQVHHYCLEKIATIPSDRRVLVTAHDAFGYFGAAYGLEVHGLKGISSADEIDLEHHKQVQDLLVARKIPAVFVESSIAPRSIEALIETCRAAGHEVSKGGELYADVLAPEGQPGDTYAGMMRHNVDTIVAALAGE